MKNRLAGGSGNFGGSCPAQGMSSRGHDHEWQPTVEFLQQDAHIQEVRAAYHKDSVVRNQTIYQQIPEYFVWA